MDMGGLQKKKSRDNMSEESEIGDSVLHDSRYAQLICSLGNCLTQNKNYFQIILRLFVLISPLIWPCQLPSLSAFTLLVQIIIHTN